jgi:DNA-binding transcriptional LysR family regulator
LDIKSLEFFVRLCKDNNVSVAAENLYISQQGLSRMIKRMESELGVKLFRRSNRGVTPTVEGKLLWEHAENILSEYQKVTDSINLNNSLIHGTVNVVLELGCLPLLTLSPFLRFIEEYPNVDLSFGEHRETICQAQLSDGTADVFFAVKSVDSEQFNVSPFYTLNSIVYVPKKHVLAKKSFITVEDFRDTKLVLCGSTNYYTVVKDCAEANFVPNIVVCSTDINVTMQCVQSGLGVSPFILGMNKALPISEDIIVQQYRCPNIPQIHILTKKNTPLSLSAQRFCEYFFRYFEARK